MTPILGAVYKVIVAIRRGPVNNDASGRRRNAANVEDALNMDEKVDWIETDGKKEADEDPVDDEGLNWMKPKNP